MARPKITLYVDIVSPFAYLAFYALQHFPVFKQCDVTYIPIFLGGVMKACGNTAPIQIKNKDKWIDVERIRWAKAFDIPVLQTPPEGFPPNTISVQRALTAIHLAHPQKLAPSIAALYDAFWVQGRPIQMPETVLPALASALGGRKEAAEMMEKSTTREVKDLLLERTNEAVEKDHAFGLPWFVATNSNGETEGFWGFDHLGQVTDYLGLERPTVGGWKSML